MVRAARAASRRVCPPVPCAPAGRSWDCGQSLPRTSPVSEEREEWESRVWSWGRPQPLTVACPEKHN